jgi:hypothetical protein
MAYVKTAPTGEDFLSVPSIDESAAAGISWPAVFAGAFGMGALGIILMVLGAGVGLSSVSPWPQAGTDAVRISAGTVIWVILVQLIASAVGGYLAGRLRTKWVSLHTHEVFFRDTAHGFIAWCVAMVLTTILFAGYLVSFSAKPASATGANQSATYFTARLFRGASPNATDQTVRNEAAVVLANALGHPDTASDDQVYLTDVVASATGLSKPEAAQRVTETIAADREATDAARKAVAHSLYWLFVAFLVGAFCASYAATMGGKLRDEVRVSR